jgi:predicted nucleic acid-binding protein
MMAEVQKVLSRPSLQAKFSRLTPERVQQFLDRVQSKATEMTEVPKHLSLPRDPMDEPYLNLALAADAPYLVSRDHDLLDLMNDADFRTRFPNLTILDPVAFLRALRRPQEPPASDAAPPGEGGGPTAAG